MTLRTGHTSISFDSDEEETSHVVAGVQEEIPYCSPRGPLQENKKRVCSKSQPQFRSDNTLKTIEAEQILIALQHLANNNNSDNFNNNISRISKLPEQPKTILPNFDGKLEKFSLLEGLLQLGLKIHNQITEEKLEKFHTFMRGHALQTFKNISSLSRETLGEILTVFR